MRRGLIIAVLRTGVSFSGINHRAASNSRRCATQVSPLPAGERSDCEAIRVRGFGARTQMPYPLTPSLSPLGRGRSSLPIASERGLVGSQIAGEETMAKPAGYKLATYQAG